MELVWCGDDPKKYSSDVISNKAKGLMDLYLRQQKGLFSVPDFFVIPATFMKNYVRKNSLQDIMQIYDVKQINEIYYSTRDSYCASGAPRAISSQFSNFLSEYSKILIPAIDKLTNVKAYNRAVKRNQKIAQKNPPTINDFIKKMRDGDDGCGFEKLPEYHELIYRSASPLEQGRFFFDGVFLSTNSFWDTSAHDKLSLILSSSWSPYALFCMTNIGEKSHDMAVIVQKEIFPRYSGQVIFNPDETFIKYNLNWTMARAEHSWKADSRGNPANNNRNELKHILENLRDANRAIKDNHFEFLHGHTLGQNRDNCKNDLEVWKFENIYAHKLHNLRPYFARTDSKVQLEFVIDKSNEIHLVQQRIKPLHEISTLSKPEININKIITENLGCEMILDESGIAINMLTYNGSESVGELDSKYHKSILIMAGDKGWEHYKKLENETRHDSLEEAIKKTLVSTPNRTAVIVPLSKERWVHLFDVFNDLKLPVLAYDEYNKEVVQSLNNIETGEKLAIWSNAKESILYRKD